MDAGEEAVDDVDHRLSGKPLPENGTTTIAFFSSDLEVTNMPFGNRKGPWGLGPMTGRAAGYCSGNDAPGYLNTIGGRLFRRRAQGGGRGQGFRFGRQSNLPEGEEMANPFTTPATREEQLATLKGRAGQIQRALESIQSHINDLEAEGKDAS